MLRRSSDALSLKRQRSEEANHDSFIKSTKTRKIDTSADTKDGEIPILDDRPFLFGSNHIHIIEIDREFKLLALKDPDYDPNDPYKISPSRNNTTKIIATFKARIKEMVDAKTDEILQKLIHPVYSTLSDALFYAAEHLLGTELFRGMHKFKREEEIEGPKLRRYILTKNITDIYEDVCEQGSHEFLMFQDVEMFDKEVKIECRQIISFVTLFVKHSIEMSEMLLTLPIVTETGRSRTVIEILCCNLYELLIKRRCIFSHSGITFAIANLLYHFTLHYRYYTNMDVVNESLGLLFSIVLRSSIFEMRQLLVVSESLINIAVCPDGLKLFKRLCKPKTDRCDLHIFFFCVNNGFHLYRDTKIDHHALIFRVIANLNALIYFFMCNRENFDFLNNNEIHSKCKCFKYLVKTALIFNKFAITQKNIDASHHSSLIARAVKNAIPTLKGLLECIATSSFKEFNFAVTTMSYIHEHIKFGNLVAMNDDDNDTDDDIEDIEKVDDSVKAIAYEDFFPDLKINRQLLEMVRNNYTLDAKREVLNESFKYVEKESNNSNRMIVDSVQRVRSGFRKKPKKEALEKLFNRIALRSETNITSCSHGECQLLSPESNIISAGFECIVVDDD